MHKGLENLREDSKLLATHNSRVSSCGKATIYNTKLDVLRITVTDIHGQQRVCRHYVRDFVKVAEQGSEVFCG